jgi:hypothetical protein
MTGTMRQPVRDLLVRGQHFFHPTAAVELHPDLVYALALPTEEAISLADAD